MKTNYKKTLTGSIVAFILGTSCCWLTTLAVWLGGAAFLTILAQFVTEYKTIILTVAVIFFVTALYQYWKHTKAIS